MNDYSRREFLARALKGGLMFGGAAAFGGLTGPLAQLAFAADPKGGPDGGIGTVPTITDRYYIFCYFSGGWDTLLSLDPRDPAKFHSGNISKTRIEPNYAGLNDTSPPHNGKLVVRKGKNDKPETLGWYLADLADHWDKIAIIRGMSMDTLTHEVGRRRFLTGKPPSGLLARGSSGATWLAGMLGGKQTIPNLAARVETYNKDQANFATGLKVGSVADLVRSLKPDETALAANIDQLIDVTLSQSAACGYAKQSPMWQAAEASRQKARQMVGSGLDKTFGFAANTPEMAKLRAHYGIKGGAAAASTSAAAQAAMAVTALTAGISRVVSIEAASGLDTHFDDWSDDQGPRQAAGFNLVARMLEDLGARAYPGGGTWLDRTTIVGFSEFSRSAMMSTRGGRDHALTNACFVAGAGIAGGQVIGRSSDVGLNPVPCNLLTGEPDSTNGEIIKPEHVYRSLLWDIGVTKDIADLRCPPLKALLKNA